MSYQDEYYYGQGKVYLAPYQASGHIQWRWVGDVSSLTLNFEFEEKSSKRSLGGRLITDKRFITFTGGNASAVWFERSVENLELLLRGKSSTHRQSWTQEQFNNIEKGMSVSLQKQNVRYVVVEGLDEGADYIVNYALGSVFFLVKPLQQPITIEYDYSASNSIGILNQEPTELMLRYQGINLAEDCKNVFVELYRLSFDPIDSINLIDDKSEFSNVETVLQLLPDLTKSPKSDLGLFGRIIQLSEFKTILYNDEIIHDGTHDFAY